MQTAGFTLNQPETVYFVGQQKSWASNRNLFDGLASNSALAQITSTPQVEVYAGTGAAVTGTWPLSTSAVITCVFSGASSALRVNRAVAATGNANTNNAGGFSVGASHSGSFMANTLVFEILVFNVAHSTAQQNQIIQYLGNKWGIAV